MNNLYLIPGKRNINLTNEKKPLSIFRTEIEDKKGEWLDRNFPHGAREGDGRREGLSLLGGKLKDEKITVRESSNARLVHHEPQLKERVIESIIQCAKVG